VIKFGSLSEEMVINFMIHSTNIELFRSIYERIILIYWSSLSLKASLFSKAFFVIIGTLT